ncbi:MAG: hypothetical protein NCW75_01250 [Phycisphaera sp.]|nr:MAG: hypothetical protein NCW75_01250 [Phycisphaera sp.]
MMNQKNTLSSRLIAAAGLAATAAAAFGQCEPAWDYAIGTPGVDDGYVQPIFVWDDGTGEALYAGGSFGSMGAAPDTTLIAQWDGSEWSGLGSPGLSTGSTNGFVTSMAAFDVFGTEALVVGGFFASAGAMADTQSLAAWTGSEWVSMGSQLVNPDAVWALTSGDLGSGDALYAGGSFTSIGGISAGGIAQWDGENWAAVGDGNPLTGVVTPNVFGALVFDDGSGPALYAGGRFDEIDGVPGTTLLGRFKDGAWEPVGAGLVRSSITGDAGQMAIFDDGSGPALYIGGRSFFAASVGTGFDVWKWDGTEWSGVGQDISGIVTKLFVWDDGSGEALYMGTSDSSLGRLARLEGDAWVGYGGGADGGSAFGLGEWNGDLYFGGSFETVNGEAASGIVKRTGCAGGTCYADFDGDGELTIFDFLGFQNAFDAGDLAADCDEDGDLTLFDFLCFQNAFDAGCP